MSLRPDARSSHSRSKSRDGRSRSRSRSDAHRASTSNPTYYTTTTAAPSQTATAGPTYGRDPTKMTPGLSSYAPQGQAQYTARPQRTETESESESDEESITMGNYTDLPPHERPGYIQQQQQQQAGQGYQYTATPQYAQPAAPTTSQGWNYTATPQTAADARGIPGVQYTSTPQTSSGAQGSYQYAQPGQIKYTANPVTGSSKGPPAILHTASPSHGQAQYQPPYQPSRTDPMPQEPHLHAPQPRQPSSLPRRGDASASPYSRTSIVEVSPNSALSPTSTSPPKHGHRLGVSGRDDRRAPSPGLSLHTQMDRLSVSGNRPDIQTIAPGGAHPPPSPMLEAYHGTYQSISPMPMPLRLPDDDEFDNMMLDPRHSSSSIERNGSRHERKRSTSNAASLSVRPGHSRKRSTGSVSHSSSQALVSRRKESRSPPSNRLARDRERLERGDNGLLGVDDRRGKGRSRSRSNARDHSRDRRQSDLRDRSPRVKIYDAAEDCAALAAALKPKPPSPGPLVDILPSLTHDQILELRKEFKRSYPIMGQPINISKLINMKMGKSSGSFGRIVYITSLGRWESESYWANTWYQSSNANRELLIESLMGRSNYEIDEIINSFRDKRYGDDLIKCMDKELKADKFRTAVLMALENKRQEETELRSNDEKIYDADDLYAALHDRSGHPRESAMLKVVVTRSDRHLRDVLRIYERKYQESYAKEVVVRCKNLVGEVIAHILNGVINRPARDAMLLNHALMDLQDPAAASSRHERQQRYELLTSRLVRIHWDRMHMGRVKQEYVEKYRRELEDDIEDSTKGDYRDFCFALCETGPVR